MEKILLVISCVVMYVMLVGCGSKENAHSYKDEKISIIVPEKSVENGDFRKTQEDKLQKETISDSTSQKKENLMNMNQVEIAGHNYDLTGGFEQLAGKLREQGLLPVNAFSATLYTYDTNGIAEKCIDEEGKPKYSDPEFKAKMIGVKQSNYGSKSGMFKKLNVTCPDYGIYLKSKYYADIPFCTQDGITEISEEKDFGEPYYLNCGSYPNGRDGSEYFGFIEDGDLVDMSIYYKEVLEIFDKDDAQKQFNYVYGGNVVFPDDYAHDKEFFNTCVVTAAGVHAAEKLEKEKIHNVILVNYWGDRHDEGIFWRIFLKTIN